MSFSFNDIETKALSVAVHLAADDPEDGVLTGNNRIFGILINASGASAAQALIYEGATIAGGSVIATVQTADANGSSFTNFGPVGVRVNGISIDSLNAESVYISYIAE